MRETEKAMKEVQAYLEQKARPDMEIDELNEMVRKFLEEQNRQPRPVLTEKTAKTSDDFEREHFSFQICQFFLPLGVRNFKKRQALGIVEALTKQSFVDEVIGRKDMQISLSY